MSLQEIVTFYRRKRIEGKYIDLVPLAEEHLARVVELRNQPRSRYFLHQDYALTLEMQRQWYEHYLTTADDLYWCVCNKAGTVVGVIRLYNICPESCNQGSFIIDEAESGMPYALETEILTIEFAFTKLQVRKIINDDRADNKTMNSMSRKLGFQLEKKVYVRGVEFNYYVLTPERSKLSRYKAFFEDFSKAERI